MHADVLAGRHRQTEGVAEPQADRPGVLANRLENLRLPRPRLRHLAAFPQPVDEPSRIRPATGDHRRAGAKPGGLRYTRVHAKVRVADGSGEQGGELEVPRSGRRVRGRRAAAGGGPDHLDLAVAEPDASADPRELRERGQAVEVDVGAESPGIERASGEPLEGADRGKVDQREFGIGQVPQGHRIRVDKAQPWFAEPAAQDGVLVLLGVIRTHRRPSWVSTVAELDRAGPEHRHRHLCHVGIACHLLEGRSCQPLRPGRHRLIAARDRQ